MKQIKEAPKEKPRALAVIHYDEGFDWSDFLLEDDAVGYTFLAKVEPFKDTRTEEQKYNYRKMLAQTMKGRNYRAWKEAKKANQWDSDREFETLIEQLKREDEERKKEHARKAEEEELKSKKVDDGIIYTTKELTPENLTKMADKVLMDSQLEVDSKSPSKSTNMVSGSSSSVETGKNEKG
ncbi:hypothetical protein Hanom_Chr09g00807491 [Helianthus anomalus]